ncbi:hypothetical protein Taro_041470 [Colocasia esculenta]|uniref:Uncharacterized protein n=1 Tax=Colocasia esculenta TaxID=4460 RepID=A0A843WBK2_COLES|nr:hypothetical protein [Colocasia esculenta]
MRIATGVGRSRHGYCRDGLVNATEAGKGRDRTNTGIATAYLSLSERDGELWPESLKVSGMGLGVCDLQVVVLVGLRCSWLVVVERQLDLSSVTARLRAGDEVRPCVLWRSCGVILHVLCVTGYGLGLAGSMRLKEESWQTCTTSSRVVESPELVLPRGMTSGNNENAPSRYGVCGTIEVCVVFLDTLTPMYWAPASLVPEPHFRELGPESLKVPAGLRVRGYETERLFLCCVVRSRFNPFEVCPGVGTVVIAIVAYGVPEWWHSFGYGWYMYPVWVMVCGGLGVTVVERTSGEELILLFPFTFRGLTVGSACEEVVADSYHQQ